MKTRKIKKLLIFGILFLTSSLFLWNCEKEETIPETQQTLNQKRLGLQIYNWEHFEKENTNIASELEKFRKKNIASRDIESSQYGFVIDEEKVQIIENDGYTTYTFVVKRDEQQEGILENYMYKEFDDGSYKQFLLTYYYTSDSEGNVIFDITDMGVELIDDDSLLLNRTASRSGECHPHFDEVLDSFNCTFNHTCTGDGHEVGDECQCQVTVFTCDRAGSTTCEAGYSYVFDDCSGENDTGDVENPNDPNNPPTGGGSGNNNNDDNDGNTDSVPLEEETPYERVIDCMNGSSSLNGPNVLLPTHLMNHLAGEPFLSAILSRFIEENGCSLGNETHIKEIVEASYDGTLISVAPFVKYPTGSNYATLYPKLTEYLKNQLPTIKNNSIIVNAIKTYTDQTLEQIKTDLQWGKGPVIKIEQLGSAYGKFKKSNDPNSLYLDIDIVNLLENSTSGSSLADAFAFLVGVTVLHEYVHYGDYNYNGDYWQYPQEEGLLFENDVYGQSVWIENAEIILKNN